MSVVLQQAAELFYFGPPDQQLYGALHHAQTYAAREHGVLICYPFGQEYIRSHRACRQLAFRLAGYGFPVLRFDYSGTGDSAGDAEHPNLDDWRADIRLAIETLQDRGGVDSICLVGLRLGASLALDVAVECEDVTSLVLWEPVISGSKYLAELTDQHREFVWRFFDDPDGLSNSGFGEYLGFPISDEFRSGLERLELLAGEVPQADHVLIVESQTTPDMRKVHEHLRAAGLDVDYRHIPSFAAWSEDVDKGLVPDAILGSITSWADEVLT